MYRKRSFKYQLSFTLIRKLITLIDSTNFYLVLVSSVKYWLHFSKMKI